MARSCPIVYVCVCVYVREVLNNESLYYRNTQLNLSYILATAANTWFVFSTSVGPNFSFNLEGEDNYFFQSENMWTCVTSSNLWENSGNFVIILKKKASTPLHLFFFPIGIQINVTSSCSAAVYNPKMKINFFFCHLSSLYNDSNMTFLEENPLKGIIKTRKQEKPEF